jgi:putative transcriptional regulator
VLTQGTVLSMQDGSRSRGGPKQSELGLYNRLPVLRAERGLSRQDLAAAVDVNHQTVGYLERGDYSPSLELAFRISDFFGLPIEAIFSRQPFRPLSEQVYARERREDLNEG